MDPFDVIVIGGGLGGLTAAAKLAVEHRRVLLLEQHSVVGGYASTYRRGDYRIEVGLHEMNGMDDLDPKRRIFEELGIFDSVEFVRVPEFYRLVTDRFEFVMPDSDERARTALLARFPGEAAGIERFFGLLGGAYSERGKLPRRRWVQRLQTPLFPLLYPNLTTTTKYTLGAFLDRTFRDEELKLILGTNFGYYGDDPHSLSLFYFAMAQGGYFKGGGHFIKGGSQVLSNHLARVVERHGGTVSTGCEVVRIVTERDRAVGVQFVECGSSEVREARAAAVVANAAVPEVASVLLPPGRAQAKLVQRIAGLRRGPSLSVVYLGFKGLPRDRGNRWYSTFVVDGVSTLREMAAAVYGDIARRPFVFADYGLLDAGLAPAGKSTGTIALIDSLAEWENLSRGVYEEKKERLADVLLDRLERLLPGIGAHVDYREVATPKTMRRYTRNPDGCVYGFAQTPDQAGRKRFGVKSPVRGLYFASAWAFPGGGFSGAIIGGYLAARRVLDDTRH